MNELRPLIEILEVKDELIEKYIKLMNPPRKWVKDIVKEIDVVIKYNVNFMPYWMVKELEKLGFDINENQENLF